ncbi:MAG: class 1 fructose-bisphosphatase [Acetobacteraceae bacterium]|nr:class 1 fructose-bisphosphatase [Acetobacteraceae bacterium]
MTLQDYLDCWAEPDPARAAVAATLAAFARASVRLAGLIADGPLAGDVAAVIGESEDGDGQKALDAHANALFRDALAEAPVTVLVSEEEAAPVRLRGGASLAVALDPLDGSNNIAVNGPLATIFSILPAAAGDDVTASFRQPGTSQLAAGFVLYGPHTSLVLTVRSGVALFILDRHSGTYRQTRQALSIPEGRDEYAVNASNQRHWTRPVRDFVAECVAGADGPRGRDFNTRWLGCVAAEVYRILLRGGVYLYPGDDRPGYRRGRLRLLYEANPLALLAEEAGGAATDGTRRILDLVAREPHERAPLVLGAREEVARLGRDQAAGIAPQASPPLFGTRGLFRAG